MNNLLSGFSPSQTALIIAIAAVVIALIVLNIVLAYVFNKRGERKLYDLLLQQQRELLMQQLEDMRSNGTADDDKPANIKPFFIPADAEQQPVVQNVAPEVKSVEESVEPVEEVAAPVEETVEPVEEVAEPVDDEEELDEAEEEFAAVDFSDDEDTVETEEVIINGKVIRYNRSFAARLIQSSDELKSRYSYLKNVMLAYDKVKDRRSWKKESYRRGRVTLATFVIRGKTLCLCLATDPKRFEGTKYKVADLSVRSPKNKQPCLYRIVNDRRAKYAAELIDIVFGENGAVKSERENVDYVMPYEPTEQLIEEQLIKVIGGNGAETLEIPSAEQETPAAEDASSDVTEEVAVAEEPVEEIVEKHEIPTEEVVGESEAPVEEVTEKIETVEELVEEDEDPVDEVLFERDFEILEEVDVAEAETFSDEQAEQLVEVKVVKTLKNTGKKGIVNLDSLSKNFEEGAHVTIGSLKEKGLIARDVKVLKVLAKGSINKPLIVEADDFSLVAVKMIVLTGGRVIRRTTEI